MKKSNMLVLIRNLLKKAEITRAGSFGIINVGWRFVSGPVTGLMILTYFTPELQGFYYTFSSVLALQMFVELGFSNIVTYFAGHEWAKLSLDNKGNIVGDPNALSRLVSLGRAAFFWYCIGGIVIACGLSVGGYVFFIHSKGAMVAWQAPWVVLCLVSGINFLLTPLWSLLEGCNQISTTYFYKMIGTIIVSITIWVGIYIGVGLWTAPLYLCVQFLWSAIVMMCRYRNFFSAFIRSKVGPRIHWWKEIWQVQWRTALSYLSGYFTSQVFTPIIFHYHGAVAAGQFGLTWNLASAVASVGAMWSTPRGPQFANMIARKEYQTLDKLLWRVSIASVSAMCICAMGGLLVVVGLNIIHHHFAQRILSPMVTAVILVGIIVANALGTLAVYLRAHKREPFVILSIALGIVIGAASFLLGSRYSAFGIGTAYLLSNLLIAFPWSLVIFFKCRKQWRN